MSYPSVEVVRPEWYSNEMWEEYQDWVVGAMHSFIETGYSNGTQPEFIVDTYGDALSVTVYGDCDEGMLREAVDRETFESQTDIG